ncbi:ABC transporter permease [Aminipila luticellarii]|uniref:FtsX-like permease family protein n=1 Tax=Aminipila luticellarii TaxID=2507160 RepID=A0A410PYJ7_9FIRM|nr:ABC transporter permease [Aminipila luticellarii]QAT44018.1 FtsX-like permease family protein [Aminipila luticellarii]
MLLIENIKLALSAIKVNKMRSFLTMLGIIIGISSVIAITSIGDSAKGAVTKEFEGFNANMYVMLNWEMTEDGVEEKDLFYRDDLEALKARFPDEVKYAVLYASASSETKIGRLKGKFEMSGIDADYFKFDIKNKLIYGRNINKSDVAGKKGVIVIDDKAAQFFFNKKNIVGKTIPVTIRGDNVDLTVVGVYEQEKSVFSGLDSSGSYSGYIPYTIAIGEDEGSSIIDIYANEELDQSKQAEDFKNYLTKIKKVPEGLYKSETAESQLGTINNILGILSIAIGAIAAISLLVGGIGIMNIMLVSVTERTREIGIRKSLGAQTKDILTQFLIEAMILSIIGGLIGIGIGVGIAAIGMTIAGIGVVINPMAILVAVAFSAFVGIFFGIFPARKAARLDPIEALRYE